MRIALFETITPGNIGAVARAMKNFGFKELLLVNPQCSHLDNESLQRACHGVDILSEAKLVGERELFKHYVAGTTSKAFTRKTHRQAATPDKLGFLPSEAVMLFGREDNGLPNRVLKKCDTVITIPTSTSYSSLNLSHAVAIILYELKVSGLNKKSISAGYRGEILKRFYNLSDLCGRDESLKEYLKNVFNRSIIYESEAKALMGLLTELEKQLK
ncbi:hypothetical protein GF352_01790|nr:hypothetical protein [archaeon]